jgi:hypothetical protein
MANLPARNGLARQQLEHHRSSEVECTMGRNVTLGIGTLIIILIIVALVF